MVYYKCAYDDYGTLPDILYTGHTTGMELKNVDGTKFLVRDTETPGQGILSWMNGNEQSFNNEEARKEVRSQEWIDLPSEVLSFSSNTNLYHLMSIGASNSGGYGATPAITTTPMDGVYTLTDGPLSPDTSGDLIPLIEGDTYNQDKFGNTYNNVESQITSLCQQLKSFLLSTDEVVGTGHYRGGTPINELTDGGSHSSVGYDQLVAASNRVKAIAETEGKNYIPIVIIYVNGLGPNPYETVLTSVISDIRSGLSANYDDEIQFLINQPRIVGSPDYGIQAYNVSKNVSGVHLSQPLNDITDPSELTGDAVHWNNYGQTHIGTYNAFSVNDIITNGQTYPLDLDIDNVTYDSDNSKLILPVNNSVDALQIGGSLGIEVNDINSSLSIIGTWLVNGDNLEFTITGNKPSGITDIEIITGQTGGYVKDNRGNDDVLFNNESGEKYSVENYLLRYNHNTSIDFGVSDDNSDNTSVKINLGGVGTAPVLSDGWNNISPWSTNIDQSSDAIFSIDNNPGLTLTLKNDGTTSGSWGFNSLNGNLAGNAGYNTGDDSGIVPDVILDTYVFLENATCEAVIDGLDDSKLYTVKMGGSRDATGSRITEYTIGGSTESLECIDNSLGEVTFLSVSALLGEITIEVKNTNNQFAYIGWIEIIEN